MSDIQRSIGRWAAQTFPESRIAGVLAHLNDEVRELNDVFAHEVKGMSPESALERIAEEAADVAILLYQLGSRCGFDLEQAVIDKMAINKARTWGKADSVTGVVHHSETTS